MNRWLVRICTAASALALVSTLIAIALAFSNQSLRQQVTERQRIINQGLSLSQINVRLANSLAGIALRDNDDAIRKLLADRGITVKTDQAPQPPAAPK